MRGLRPRSGSAVDSLLLASVKLVTLGSTMANTMILSHSLSLEAYGTYAQGVLLVTLCADATILGLADAVNFFFNRDSRESATREYVNSVFVLQIVIGVATAAALVALRGAIGDYFSNPALTALVVFLAFRPMLTNMTSVLQVLIVSIGRARAIAVRNVVFSALKLMAVLVTALLTSSIATLFAMLLVLDLLSVLWFWDCFRRWKYMIRLTRPRWGRIREILGFSLPMAVYVLTASLMRQVGQLVIGMNESTDRYAIYANSATVLPLDVVSMSFLTVIIPIVTRHIGAGQKEQVRVVFKHYLAVGYLTTVTFSVACLVVAPEVIQVLYGARYLPGYTVFCLYLVTAMVRFASLSLILSASGRTKALMVVSLAAVAVNAVLCIVLYSLIGFVGPALASVVVNVGMAVVLVRLSLREIDGDLATAFDPRAVGTYTLTTLAAAAAGYGLRWGLVTLGLPAPAVAALVMCAVSAAVLALNLKPLRASLRAINAMK